jgi:hypothetical protein
VVDDRDFVGQPIRLVEVLRRQQDCGAFADKLAHHRPYVAATAWIEAGGRFVEEQNLRRGDQAGGEIEAPSHAARVRLRRPVAGLGQLEMVKQIARALLRGFRRDLQQPPDHQQVLEAGQVLVDRGVLTGQPDHRPHPIGVLHDVESADRCVAGIRSQQGGEHADDRRLARAIRPEEAEHRPRLHGQVDTVHRRRLAEAFDQTLGLDRICHGTNDGRRR